MSGQRRRWQRGHDVEDHLARLDARGPLLASALGAGGPQRRPAAPRNRFVSSRRGIKPGVRLLVVALMGHAALTCGVLPASVNEARAVGRLVPPGPARLRRPARARTLHGAKRLRPKEVAAPAPEAAPPPSRRVLLIGLDGLRPDALRKAKTPHLDRLAVRGAYSYRAQAGPVTLSGPGWSTALTGVEAAKHRVKDNRFRRDGLDRWPSVFERLERARPEAVTASLVAWNAIDAKILRGDPLDVRQVASDEVLVERGVALLRDGDPTLLFVHLDAIDAAGHEHGHHPDVAPYLAAVEQADRQLGRLLEALDGRPDRASEDWLVVVTTDHGGSRSGHGMDVPSHRTVFVILRGAHVAPGELVPAPSLADVAPTVLTHLGLAPEASWGLDGRAVGLRPDPGPVALR